MKAPHAIVLSALAAAAIFAGCQSPATFGTHSNVSVSGDRIIGATLFVDSPSLARHVSMSGVRTRMLPNGLLEVQAALESNDKRDFSIQYKFRWFDNAGMEIPNVGQEPWVVAVIHGGEICNAVGVAPMPDVSGFKISVRRF